MYIIKNIYTHIFLILSLSIALSLFFSLWLSLSYIYFYRQVCFLPKSDHRRAVLLFELFEQFMTSSPGGQSARCHGESRSRLDNGPWLLPGAGHPVVHVARLCFLEWPALLHFYLYVKSHVLPLLHQPMGQRAPKSSACYKHYNAPVDTLGFDWNHAGNPHSGGAAGFQYAG